jgi:hypothetical protein
MIKGKNGEQYLAKAIESRSEAHFETEATAKGCECALKFCR